MILAELNVSLVLRIGSPMWIELYGYASAFCSALIGIMLGLNRKKSPTFKIGAFLFLSISIWLVQLYLFTSGKLFEFPALIFWHIPFAIATGPLFYLFIQSIFKMEYLQRDPTPLFTLSERSMRKNPFRFWDRFLWDRIQWFHVLLVSLLTALFLPVGLLSTQEKLEIFRKNESVVSPLFKNYILFFLNMSYLVPGVYIAFSFRFLFNARILFNAGQERSLSVFYLILGWFGVSKLITFGGFIQGEFSFLKTLGAFGFSTGVFLIFILLSRYPDFLEILRRGIREIRRKQSRINSDLKNSALEKIKVLFEEEKIYLNDELSLKSLGNQLSLRPDQLSQVVNDSYGMNFNRFLNYHRVREAIRILEKDPAAKIIHVAMRCGFNSKSSFNESFRRETGTTPTEYLRKKGMES
ncbi:helix-turn-helix domain-containing protein [Leptospira sp. FAT2]|uniref:AraC family transcriptional regulator n=1 Tax=Leptospira sanjuanensis TaxID=2879643 RepID=UPI001EE8D73B|nr:helix-turn-helix domain-containing protein [Leptospira sanjuanensis]MCG6169565.1 helix-turn-helix domain-containing protein [Leptospira sanjuanensis]MCG6194965.1 helix-turn-helix domain-containing protein [Leptospira sanjuanensis]